MELIPHNLSVDFIGKRKYFIVGSIIINCLILIGIGIWGFNWGVDFAGGTEIEVKFAQTTQAADVRKAIEGAEFSEATVQTIGAESENSFLIRVGGKVSVLTRETAKKGEDALRAKLGANLLGFDFNPDYGDKIELRTQTPVPQEGVSATLASAGINAEKLNAVPGGYTIYTTGIADHITKALGAAEVRGLPKAELRRVEFVGPQVGKELRNKGILSIVYAAIAILIYIALRFDTRFAPGAVVGMFHDIIMVFGYFLVTRREFNLTSVAVLLTVVGYSVNDTIVIYDRIRENLGKMRGVGLASLINTSINETFARTLLTSFGTALSLVGLLIFGVGQIFDFSAAMLLGIITGTYSSIYIASPMTIWLEELRGKREQEKLLASKR